MGYRTNYKLKMKNLTEEQEMMMIGYITKHQNEFYGEDILSDLIKYKEYEATWYDHKLDMEKISSKFPEVEFILSGEGEENDNIWEETYLNGEIISAKIAEINMVEQLDNIVSKSNYLLSIYTENLKTEKTKHRYDKLKDLIESVKKPNEIFNTYYLTNATEILEELKNKIREE